MQNVLVTGRQRFLKTASRPALIGDKVSAFPSLQQLHLALERGSTVEFVPPEMSAAPPTCVKADAAELAAVVATLTGEPHPLAAEQIEAECDAVEDHLVDPQILERNCRELVAGGR